MIVALAGAVLVVLGVFSGGVLVVAPLGLAPFTPGPALWILFPVFSILGYALLVIGARTAHIRVLSLALSWLLVLLALAAAAGLVLSSADILRAPGGTVALWYVLAIGGALGLTTAAAAMRVRGWSET